MHTDSHKLYMTLSGVVLLIGLWLSYWGMKNKKDSDETKAKKAKNVYSLGIVLSLASVFVLGWCAMKHSEEHNSGAASVYYF